MRKGSSKCESCRNYIITHSYGCCEVNDGIFNSPNKKCPYFKRKKIIKYPIG